MNTVIHVVFLSPGYPGMQKVWPEELTAYAWLLCRRMMGSDSGCQVEELRHRLSRGSNGCFFVIVRAGWHSLKMAASLPEWLTDCRQAAVLINRKMRDKNKGKAVNGLPQDPHTSHGRVGAKM
ncbi:hypothetical protein [Aeromonas veronii]